MFISRPTRTTISLRDVSLLIVDDSIVVRNLIKWALKSSDAAAIQELADENAALRTRIEKLEAAIEELLRKQ